MDRAFYLLIGSVFCASRALYFAAGIRYDASSLTRFWQFLDTAYLRDDLFRSLWYLHAQPPLFNLYLGLVLKLGLSEPSPVFQGSFVAAGLGLHLAFAAVLIRLGVPRPLAGLATALLAISPASILYENWLFYTYPLAAILTVAALLLHRFVSQGRRRDGLAFFSALAAAVALRSVFHPLWFVGAVCGVWAVFGRERRRVIQAAALPAGLVAMLVLKNLLLFGSAATSSWFGLNFAKMTTSSVPREERHRMVQSGEVSELVLVFPFSPLERFGARVSEAGTPPVPVLRDRVRPGGGPNYNHASIPAISRVYRDDAWVMLREHPPAYFSKVGQAWLLFLVPPSEAWFLDQNRERIAGLDALFNGLVYLVAEPIPTQPEVLRKRAWYGWLTSDPGYAARHAGYGWAVLVVLALGFAVRTAARKLRGEPEDRAKAAVLLYCALIFLYLAVVGNSVEIGENNRFRMEVEPLAAILLTFGIAQAWRAARVCKLRACTGACGVPPTLRS